MLFIRFSLFISLTISVTLAVEDILTILGANGTISESTESVEPNDVSTQPTVEPPEEEPSKFSIMLIPLISFTVTWISCIVGFSRVFCDKDEAVRIVSCNPEVSTMMMRFSDSKIGYIMITYYLPQGKTPNISAIRARLERPVKPHIPLSSEKVEKDPLTKFLQTNAILKLIDNIYPDIPKNNLYDNCPPRANRKIVDFGPGYETEIVTSVLTLEDSPDTTDSDDQQSDDSDSMDIDLEPTVGAVPSGSAAAILGYFGDLTDGDYNPQGFQENQFEYST